MKFAKKTAEKFIDSFPKTREGTYFLGGFLLALFLVYLYHSGDSLSWVEVVGLITAQIYFVALMSSADRKCSNKESAVAKAKEYVSNFPSTSRNDLIEQLKYEGYTQFQAENAVDEVGF